MRPSFFHHLHPPTIPAPQARLRYTLGAGGFAFFLFLVIFLTGALEAFYYLPTAEGAPQSIQTITYLAPYGALLRNLHYWAAQFLVLAAGLHLLRVIFTGAYMVPRRFNYWLGLASFVLILFLDFTGYALRWDSGVHWALVAGTNLLKTIPLLGPAFYAAAVGGSQVGDATVVRFYGWHIFGLTLAICILLTWHIFRVRRDGGIAVPSPEQRSSQERITRFDLVRREALAALLLGAGLILVSTFFPAPIAAPMTAAGQPVDVRAPWFFLWVQQLLKLGDPFLFGVIIPLLSLGLLAAVPYIAPVRPEELGLWFPPSGRLGQLLVAALSLTVLALSLLSLAQ